MRIDHMVVVCAHARISMLSRARSLSLSLSRARALSLSQAQALMDILTETVIEYTSAQVLPSSFSFSFLFLF